MRPTTESVIVGGLSYRMQQDDLTMASSKGRNDTATKEGATSKTPVHLWREVPQIIPAMLSMEKPLTKLYESLHTSKSSF